ncbi:MAG TPA: ferritin-like domain-containing protein [Usitatibacter sp.]|nr:ferritin-like domain-containing protein [Usitatibacter sp.]
MENRTELGMNRTGLQVSPVHMKKMVEVTELTQPSSDGDEAVANAMRATYIAEADPVGTMPPPATVKGAIKSGIKMMAGKRPQVFLDKLGERLAFERTGTRLYAALIAKCEAPHEGAAAVSLEQLRRFQQEEAEHFALVKESIEQLGGDPTTQTPCADVAGVESMGLMQVVTDPKTTINQSLHAILVAELADNAAWDELIVLARAMGHDEMAVRFEAASAHEMEHLETIRQWHQDATLQDAKAVSH